MDDGSVYGPEFHRLGFGQAVEQGLLTDYKVLIMTVDENYIARSLQSPLADDNSELNLDDAVKIVGCWNGLAKRSGITSDGSWFAPGEVPMRRAVAFSRSIKESKKLTQEFTAVIDSYDDADGGVLRCEVRPRSPPDAGADGRGRKAEHDQQHLRPQHRAGTGA